VDSHRIPTPQVPMSITIANTTFNHVKYDALGDVLYLNVGDSADAVTFDDTPEGHNVGWNAAGELVAVALLHPRLLLDQDGKVSITLPARVDVSADALGAALVAA
jgi:hypothetical protein